MLLSEPTRIDEGVQALVRGAQTGDEAAFERLVRRYYDQIHRWALARTGDPDDADDVVQEALVRLHRHLPSFDGRSQFTTWLYQVTRSAAGDLHRKRSRRQRLADKAVRLAGPAAEDPREVETTDERQAAGLVKTFLQELSERQREPSSRSAAARKHCPIASCPSRRARCPRGPARKGTRRSGAGPFR